ncbi:MAG: DNA mismatch repair protein MutS2 [Limisphaerales bacterium]|jgi:DNA mismatch repair protein MutS2
MLYYPEDLTTLFEFDKIVEKLSAHCRSVLGVEHADEINLLTDKNAITARLDEAWEFRQILYNDVAYPDHTLPDIRPELSRLEIDDAVLSLDDMFRIRQVASGYGLVFRFLTKHNEEYPRLNSWMNIVYEKAIAKHIDRVIDQDGNIKPDASSDLVKIRKNIDAKKRELHKVFRSVLQQLKKDGVLADSGESVRSGRRVLALKAEFKRKVSGIVHDESDSGKTTFMEPEATVAVNNAVSELEREEFREIQRILRALSRDIAPFNTELRHYLQILGWLDFSRARGAFGMQLNAGKPEISTETNILLHHAYHPLLLLLNQKHKKHIEPLNLTIDRDNKIIVISGPNAGGKSVCLKTVGLLQLMVQSGLLVPVDCARSKFGIFNEILGDIGDFQSLEDELSTYSARLYRMRFFLEHATKKTLFLIDEFGSGTDPGLGGAVAEAILDSLRKKGAYGLVTTHYSNLKIYAEANFGVINAAMAFDEKELRPLYRIQSGKPGSSYTFEIARKIALPDEVIMRAERLVDSSNLEFEELLSKVQGDEQAMTQKLKELSEREKFLERRIEEYEQATAQNKATTRKKELASKEKEAEQLIAFEKEMQVLLEQLKKDNKQVSEEEVRKASRRIRSKQEKVSGEMKRIRKVLNYKESSNEVVVGSNVKLIDGSQVGKVLELRKKIAVVAFNQLKTTVKKDDLVVVEQAIDTTIKKQKIIRPDKPTGVFSSELDIRGKTKEEALQLLDRFINDAMMHEVLYVRVIHGKGTGVLRQAVRQAIKGYPVSGVKFEDAKLGGDGVTIIEFA